MTTWDQVWPLHQANVGFEEGPNNENPWTESLGIGDTQYCAAAATGVPYDAGVRWWPDSQFGERGFAYCPYLQQRATQAGIWRFDHASKGDPADLLPGDLVLFSWGNNGVADHVETVVAVYADLTYDDVGYNTGQPEGCHFPIRRDRKYLLGRVRMEGSFYSGSTPFEGGHMPTGYHFRMTAASVADWQTLDGFTWVMDVNGAIYAGPGSPALSGVNGQDYFVNRTADKLHVRKEADGSYDDTVEATSGELYRPSRRGAPFRTH